MHQQAGFFSALVTICVTSASFAQSQPPAEAPPKSPDDSQPVNAPTNSSMPMTAAPTDAAPGTAVAPPTNSGAALAPATPVAQTNPAPIANTAPVAPSPPIASGASSGVAVQVVPLRLMLQKGMITQAEYDSAVKDMQESIGSERAANANTSFVIGKWATTLYGFADADYIYDSTQSMSDIPGAPLIARPTTYAGKNDRVQFSPRNSRVGLRFKAPEFEGIRPSAQFEGDFVETVAPVGYTQPYQQSESNFYTNPVFRIRHYFMKVETPVVDMLFGQTWHLFGWQSTYHPNTDQPQGVPGQIYSRTPQIRISKTLKTDDITFDIAVAAMRPQQRDSGIPEGEAGIHLAFNNWTATQTMGATGTTVSPLSIAVTGDMRSFRIPEFAATPVNSNSKTSHALALDVFIPILPGTESSKGNSLSVLGEAVRGHGITDMYTGLASGITYPALPLTAAGAAQTFNPQIDPGFVSYDANGNLHVIQWTVYRVGGQYYLPGLDGKLWISGNYSYTKSNNARNFGAAASTLAHLVWYDVNVMGDVTPAVRLGIEYAKYRTTYVDNMRASDDRVEGSAFYIF